jgi:hypothetical protein
VVSPGVNDDDDGAAQKQQTTGECRRRAVHCAYKTASPQSAETSGLLQEIDDVWLAAHFVEHIASTNGALRSSTQAGRKPGREPWRGCSRAFVAARHGRGLRQRG